MRQTLLCVFISSFTIASFSQEIDTTVVYEYDTVYLPADTIEQINKTEPSSDVITQKNLFSVIAGFSAYNLHGQDQTGSITSTSTFNNAFSYDAGIGLRWIFSSLMIQTGLGINIYNEKKTSTLFSHVDTSVNSDNTDTKNMLMVYYTSDIDNHWICFNVPVIIGYSGQWKKLEYHAGGGISFGYIASADVRIINAASGTLDKLLPADYNRFNQILNISAGAGYCFLPGYFIETEICYKRMISSGSLFPDRLGRGFPTVTISIRKQINFK